MPPSDSAEKRTSWNQYGDLIRAFLELRPPYAQLAREMAFILEKRLEAGGVEYAVVRHRVKSVASLVEKIQRKHYPNPLEDIDDLAGVRVVHLYRSDFDEISRILHADFDVREEIHKVDEKGSDRFGYGAKHFVVRLGPACTGARYDGLKGLDCEIQVRTVLQDAWATVDEHLAYKKASTIPSGLRRKLNSLAGVFETADDQFDRIKIERDDYVKAIYETLSDLPAFLAQEVNVDTVTAFLRWRYPDVPLSATSKHVSIVLEELDLQRYPDLSSLKDLLERTDKAFEAYRRLDEDWLVSAAGILAVCAALDDQRYRTEAWDTAVLARIEQVDHLVTQPGESSRDS